MNNMDRCISCEAKGIIKEGFLRDTDELPLCDECREACLLEGEMFLIDEDYE